uniref:Hapless 8 n=1 Tax=Cannabis sativa TaxID=3483 RepID=A0A803Q7L6_CANSA
MASKVCPVCKVFSSSSNTTLNAHIDQCLSVESTSPKWTVDSSTKLSRHRIKPRKTKLMVDIYATAIPCTLEDLDRRNGSNWATVVSSFPIQQSNDKKKKRRQYKYNKYLNKLAQTKRKLLSSSKSPRSPLKNGGQGKQYGAERSNMEKQVNPSNPGTLGRWVCSKRTGVAKKVNSEARHQQVQRKWPGNEDSRVESLQSRLDRNGEEEDVMDLSPENSDSRLEKVFYEARACHKREQPPPSSGLKRSAKSSLSSATSRGNAVERSFATMKPRQLRKDMPPSSANDYRMLKPPKCTSPVEDFEPPPSHASKFRSKARKISSAREHLLSSQRSSPVAEADDSDVANNFSALKKSQVHLMTETETDDEAALWNSDASNEFHRKFAGNESESDDDMNNETSLCRSTGFEVRQNTGVLGIAGRNAAKVSENLFSSTLDKADDDMGPTCEDEEEEDLQCSQDDPIRDSALANWRKSADPEVHKPGNRSKILSNSLQYKGALFDVEGLTGPGGTSFVSEQETFYSDRLGDDGMLVQDVNIGEEQESDEDGEASRFPEVDPILIPGPPGSFLPSPRDMGSEDFQGNSSLTTSRVQSSQDQHDFIDGDSSDSPVSATSTISNFTATRDDHHRKHAELLPSVVHQHQAIQDKIRSSLSGGSVDSSIENVPIVPRTTTNTAAERVTYDREKFKANNKIPLNDEPCCCQRKERAVQGVVLDYQESQLLRRRAMTSVIMENQQTSCNLNSRPNNNNMESRSDMYTPSSTCPTSKSEQEVVHRPAVNSSGNQNAMRGSAADAAVAKFTSRGDCDSMSPSSNSILRLMGKNLMVVNRDQDESVPQAQAQSQSQLNHITSPFSTFTGVSPSSTTQNHVYRPFQHPNFQRGSIFPGQQCVDPRISNGMRTYEGAACSFSNHRMDSGFGINMELREFEADYSIETPHRKFKTVLSGVSPVKEIITIDDAPETEADLTGDHTAKYSRGFGENPIVSSSGIMIPNYNAKRSNTSFYSCQSDHDQSMHPEPPLVHHHHHHSSGFHSLSSRQPNSSPARWSTCPTDDGSAGNHPYITASSSSSRGHMRSPAAMYNNNRQSLR